MTDAAKTELELAREALEKQAEETNKGRTGKGTRIKVGSTRGKNPQPISFENFDEEQPETLPKTLSEFMDIHKGMTGEDLQESTIISYLIEGFNLAMYTQASDPIAEYVNPAWDDDTKKGFRIVVRNYSQNAKVSIEDAVALIKPGIEAAVAAKAKETATVSA